MAARQAVKRDKYWLVARKQYKGPGCAACRMGAFHCNYHMRLMTQSGGRKTFIHYPAKTQLVKRRLLRVTRFTRHR